MWAAILVNIVALVLTVTTRAVTALSFHLFRYRFTADAVDNIRCIPCRFCLVAPGARRRRKIARSSADPSLLRADGEDSDTPAVSLPRGFVCGCRLAAVTCCERVDDLQ